MVSDTVCSGLQHAMLHQPSESATNRVLIDFVQLCCVLCDVCTVGRVRCAFDWRHWGLAMALRWLVIRTVRP